MEVITRDVLGTHYLIPVGEDILQFPIELNETAYEIYQRVQRGQSLEEITTILADRYGISCAEISSDITSCYNNLHSKGIL